MAVQGLIILSGAVPGIRDLSWDHDPSGDVVGYVPFRSEDRGSNWKALTSTPVPGTRFRDATALTEVTYTVQDTDWVSRGRDGSWVFRVPDKPLYAAVVSGRALLASLPEHARVWIDDVSLLPARIDALRGEVWLPNAYGLTRDMDWRERLFPTAGAGAVVRVVYQKLGNYVDISPESRAFYTVVPMLSTGQLAHAPGAPGTEVVNILEVDKMDFMQAEMVRRNAWLLEQAGEPVHLLMRRTKGVPCSCLKGGSARTGCTVCYETGIQGGYYGPYDVLFLDPDSEATREAMEGGVKVTRSSRSFLGPSPFIQSGDLLIRKNGERMVIGPVTYKSPRGVLLQQDYTAEKLSPGDTRYRVPLRPPVVPLVYNPGFVDAPGAATGEPVVTPATDPTKVWENPQVPTGRTVTFGNLMT